MMIQYILTAVCIGMLSIPLNAQDTLTINFEEAVSQALKGNADHNINVNNQQLNKAIKQQAFYANFPNVGINLNAQRVTGQQTQQVDDGFVVDNFTNYVNSAGLNVNVPVFNMFRRINTYKAEKLREAAGSFDVVRSEQNVIYRVSNHYLQVLLSQELLRIADENLENQKELLRQIEGYVEAGIRTLSDSYNQQSEVARLEAVSYDAYIQLMNDVLFLAEILQLEQGLIPDVEPIESELMAEEWGEMELNELLTLAYQERPEVKRDELLAESYSRDIKASKAGYFPRLNAFYNYNSFSTSIVDRSFNQQFFEFNPNGVIGLSLNIPIFGNFENKTNVTRSKISFQNQIIVQDATQRKIYQEVRLAYANYVASKKKMETTNVQLRAAEQAQKAISERFRLGISNFVDLSQANSQLVQAQSDVAQALYTRYFQNIMLMYAVGNLKLDH
jgi:outer membrane protein TolC